MSHTREGADLQGFCGFAGFPDVPDVLGFPEIPDFKTRWQCKHEQASTGP